MLHLSRVFLPWLGMRRNPSFSNVLVVFYDGGWDHAASHVFLVGLQACLSPFLFNRLSACSDGSDELVRSNV